MKTLNRYRHDYDFAPYDLYEFAEGAVDIEDCDKLKYSAIRFLEARDSFEGILEKLGIELG